ncbi:hypothetical protein FRB99_004641 [Tulasnella sp. 403]|nr:hypothetical protein FRB99_004641 [Tulasnella sp. 403]
MFWSANQANDFQSQVNGQTIAERNIQTVLGMNEPDIPSQANLSPGDAAAQWKNFLEPLKSVQPSIRLGSPAVTNTPAGKQWMYDFFGACGNGCTVDFVALHWYGLANATDFISHVTDYHNSFNRSIWVTEWAPLNFGDPSRGQPSPQEIIDFLGATQNWMDRTSFVERYAWFGATASSQTINPVSASLGDWDTLLIR